MRTPNAKALLVAALAGVAGLSVSGVSLASNPLEYPDNGSAAFSRGGAWLGVANEPIATHYNPAGLATQGSGFSVEQQLNFPKTCFYRKGPGDTITGPNAQDTVAAPDGSRIPRFIYLPVCNKRDDFPNTIPSISLAWRATKKLGIGLAIVAPSTYGTSDRAFPLTTRGYNTVTRQYQELPAPYRYMQLQQQSTIIFPTVGVGYELFEHFRVGAAFVSGIAIINTSQVGISSIQSPESDQAGDHMADDSMAQLRTKDLFIPGVILSLHWSVLPQLDIAAWARVMDAVKTSDADISLTTGILDNAGKQNPYCPGVRGCNGAAPNNDATNPEMKGALTHFKYPIPPEVRLGARFHLPRTKARLLFADGGEARDPLHDDLFDVELDGSYTANSQANTIEVRFRSDPVSGKGTATTYPTGVTLPPNADRWLGYRDSVGVRLGGQWNAIADKLGIRAGAWYETRSQDPEWLTLAPVGAARWGFGGGIVLRQDFIDFSFGYQRHESAGLNNHGDGRMLAVVGTGPGTCPGQANYTINCDATNAADRTQFRSVTRDTVTGNLVYHNVNGGHITFSADVFTIGATVRF